MRKKKKENLKNNMEFLESAYLNTETYNDYLNRFEKIALSMFEWVNLPKSMNAMYLEKCLYLYGMATILKDKNYGFINTQCSSDGTVNIYDLPTKLRCFSHDYEVTRDLYTGIISDDITENDECILVQNNFERIPTFQTLDLFAQRLYEAEQTAFINIKAQKTPVLLLTTENQLYSMKQIYSKYDGNQPIIYGDKDQLGDNVIRAIKTDAPFIADKIMTYKKQIWNEALTFLGVNNILEDKKERLISDEANSNNELINLNLQSYLVPRQEACRQFNEKFGLTGTDKEISVRVRSDLHNVIKNAESIVNDYNNIIDISDKVKDIKEV